MHSKEQSQGFMRRALELAKQAWGRTHPNPMVGAVIVEQGEIVAEGWHRAAGQPHAEVEALRALGRKPNKDAVLYVTLEPCPMCAGAMIQARLPRLVYGAKDTRYGAHESIVSILEQNDRHPWFNHTVQVSSGLMEEEAAQLLQSFFRLLRQKKEKR